MIFEGNFIRVQYIPIGWRWVYLIDYQKYAYEGEHIIKPIGMILYEFTNQAFTCDAPLVSGDACQCSIHATIGDCAFSGTDVLVNQKYTDIRDPEWAIILIGMVFVYRLLLWIVLVRKSENRG
jgi:hypothetical protein